MSVAQERSAAIEAALADVRAIEASEGVTRQSLERIKQRMIELGQRRELFPHEDFPLTSENDGEHFDVLSVDDDGRFELYIEVANKAVDVPPHNHTTWAVVVGIEGEEINSLFDVDADRSAPPKLRKKVSVAPGAGVAMMPDDFHTIQFVDGTHNMHLHLYGLCFAKLKGRTMYDQEAGEYRSFDMGID